MRRSGSKRLCWNCDGEVDKDAVKCTYCLVELTPHNIIEDEAEHINPSYQINSNNVYDNGIPVPPYSLEEDKFFDKCIEEEIDSALEGVSKAEPLDNYSNEIIPLILLPMGILFFVFSILILFFSKDGALVLTWKASSWWIYLIVGVFSAYIGIHYLSKISDK